MGKRILGSVSSISLELFDNKLPYSHKGVGMMFSSKEKLFLAYETKHLLQKGVIMELQHEEGEFIYAIFLLPKSEYSLSMI